MKQRCEDSGIEWDDEKTENQLYEARRIEQLGFMDREHFQKFLFDAVQGLNFALEPFSNLLGALTLSCSFDQSLKLLWAFKQDFEQAAMFWRMAEAKKRAEADVNDS